MKRILLMDDEKIVLEFLGRMLENLGYDVSTCTDGAQAIAAYTEAKAAAKPFDVVMMDLVICNGMGGQETVLEIKKLDPKARVIATSGHLDHPVMLDHAKFQFNASIPKPYKMDKLKEVIASVVNAPA
jgi:DNA-binding NtrC family response regulator